MSERSVLRSREAALLVGVVCLLCVAAATTIACSPSRETKRPARVVPANAGRIHGVVSLRGAPPPLELELIEKDPDVCGRAVSGNRLELGKDQGVAQAFVYLDGVPPAENPGPPPETVQLAQTACGYSPHVLTMETGAGLEVVNDDPILHSVHARATTPNGFRTMFNVAQPVQGQRTKVEAPFDSPGVIALTCEAGHPWMTAYILVAPHPYVATTNPDGEFTIEGVPPGSYQLKMWHEGVRLKRIITSLQQYEYEDPYENAQQVVVPANGEAVANFALELRK